MSLACLAVVFTLTLIQKRRVTIVTTLTLASLRIARNGIIRHKGNFPAHADLLQDKSSDIPFDITFKVVRDNVTSDKSVKGKEVMGEIKAHKLILATHSPVFKGMLFGPIKEEMMLFKWNRQQLRLLRNLLSIFIK